MKEIAQALLEKYLPYAIGAAAGLVVGISIGLQF